jgi:hypothetical protein
MRRTWAVSIRAITGVLFASALAVACFSSAAGATTPAVTITPVGSASTSGTVHDGEVVTVSVTDNSVFTPGAKVNILECADPQGAVENLPKDIGSCDGETIQGDTVLVKPGGSITEARYTIYRLPSTTLGERPDGQPVCDAGDQCVLYVGQDQNDFTQPKLFSSPFIVTSNSTSTAPAVAAASGTATSIAPTAGTSSSGLGAGDPPASLALTGPGAALPWLVLTGAILLVAGGVGHLRTRAGS